MSIAVDPRILARRGKVKRAEGRRRLHRAMAIVILLGILVGGFALTRSAALDVDHVVTPDGGHVSAAEIDAAAQLEIGAAMTDVDLEGARERIRALPWVGDVTVRRAWPNKIEITDLVERRAVLSVVAEPGVHVLVDATGRLLEGSAFAPEELPALVAKVALPEIGAVTDSLTPALAAAAAISSDVQPWVTNIVQHDDGSVDLILVDGVTVYLGAGQDYVDEVGALAAVLVGVVLDCLDTVDVSVHTRPVLTRVDGCEA